MPDFESRTTKQLTDYLPTGQRFFTDATQRGDLAEAASIKRDLDAIVAILKARGVETTEAVEASAPADVFARRRVAGPPEHSEKAGKRRSRLS